MPLGPFLFFEQLLEQETHLSLTNRVMRLEVSQGNQTCYLPYDRYGFLLVSYSNFIRKIHRFWDIRLQKSHDLENRIKGPWRSLKMSPFDTVHVAYY